MARRYGGRFSPGGAGEAPEPPRRRLKAGRVNLLFAAPFAVLPGAFLGSPDQLVLGLGAFAALEGSAWLTREGIRAHRAYDERAAANRPVIPRKIFGSLLAALGVGAAALGPEAGMVGASTLGLVGGALHLFAFGPDPLRAKGAPDRDAGQSERAARAVDEAEALLAQTAAAVEPLRRRAVTDRVDRFARAARKLFREVEADPRDLTAARRYLSVYMQGARDATAKFAAHYGKTGDEGARADWEALMDDLEAGFAARTERLMIEDRQGLDVEIEVLRERLEREGVRAR